jgi:hypothetical protein
LVGTIWATLSPLTTGIVDWLALLAKWAAAGCSRPSSHLVGRRAGAPVRT